MESANNNTIASSGPGLSQTPSGPYSLGRLPIDYEAPAVLRYSARLLVHIEKMDAARAEVREATRRLKEKPTKASRRRRAEAALVAHAKAEARLTRSAMRLREAVAAECEKEKAS